MTADATLDVVGIGNALVDVLSHETDEFIAAHGLVKGAMTLIETDRAEELYAAMGPGIEMSGGSAANTIAGVASFGGTGRLHRPGLRRPARRRLRPRPALAGRHVPQQAGDRGPAPPGAA